MPQALHEAQVAEDLGRVRELLDRAWTARHDATTDTGKYAHWASADAARFGIYGALYRSIPQEGARRHRAWATLAAALNDPTTSIMAHCDQSKQAALELVDAAIALDASAAAAWRAPNAPELVPERPAGRAIAAVPRADPQPEPEPAREVEAWPDDDDESEGDGPAVDPGQGGLF